MMKKLKALGSSHRDLEMVIAELQSLKKSAKQYQSANESVHHHQRKWADIEGGPAEADITNQSSELQQSLTSVLNEYVDELKTVRQSFETILQHSKKLDQLESKIKEIQGKEKSIRKKSQSESDSSTSQSDLRQIETTMNSLNEERLLLSTTLAESKVKDLKTALITSSDAHIHLANQMLIIFSAQKELAKLLPDSDEYIHRSNYTSTNMSDRIVKDARTRLSLYKENHVLMNGTHTATPNPTRSKSQTPSHNKPLPPGNPVQPSAPIHTSVYQPSQHQTGTSFLPLYNNQQLGYTPQGYIPVSAIPVTINPYCGAGAPVFYLQQQQHQSHHHPPPTYTPDYNGSMSSSSKSSRSTTLANHGEPYSGHISLANHKPPDFPPASAEPPIKSRSRSLTKSIRRKFSGKSKSSSNLSSQV